MTSETPKTLGYSRSRNGPGTAGNGSAANRSPFPLLYRAGTGERPGTTTPNWVADKAARSRRAAHHKPCPRCGGDTLVGPDHDTVAYVARVDTTPVDPIHEVAGLLTGRFSFDLVRGELHARLDHHHHSSSRRYPVLLTHVCHETRLF